MRVCVCACVRVLRERLNHTSLPLTSSRTADWAGSLQVQQLKAAVCGLWFVVCGLWSVVCGLWFVVCGLWFVVCGLWFGISVFGFGGSILGCLGDVW